MRADPMPRFEVEYANKLRRDLETIRALMCDTAGTDALTRQQRDAICTGFALIEISLDKVRETVAEQCAPWFRVEPTFREFLLSKVAA